MQPCTVTQSTTHRIAHTRSAPHQHHLEAGYELWVQGQQQGRVGQAPRAHQPACSRHACGNTTPIRFTHMPEVPQSRLVGTSMREGQPPLSAVLIHLLSTSHNHRHVLWTCSGMQLVFPQSGTFLNSCQQQAARQGRPAGPRCSPFVYHPCLCQQARLSFPPRNAQSLAHNGRHPLYVSMQCTLAGVRTRCAACSPAPPIVS